MDPQTPKRRQTLSHPRKTSPSMWMKQTATSAGRSLWSFAQAVGTQLVGLGRDCGPSWGQQDVSYYEHPIWAAIKEGRLEDVQNCVKKDSSCLSLRGDVGEAPLHWCYLYYGANQRHIACWLLEHYPQSAECSYEGAAYQGENVLHMAVIHRDIAMVQWLVKEAPHLLLGQATGLFFQPEGTCYYGETPLMFAACTGQRAMLDILLQCGADLTRADSHGNSIFHLMVWHGLVDMYEYALTLWDYDYGDPSQLLNNDMLSPLTLAAKLGRKKMLEHLLAKKSMLEEWQLGNMALYLCPLDEIDYIPETDEIPERPTAIDMLLQEGHADLLRQPRIHAILQQKWDLCLKKIFAQQLLKAVLQAVLFTVAVLLDDSEWWPAYIAGYTLSFLIIICAVQRAWFVLHRVWREGRRTLVAAKGSQRLSNYTVLTFAVCVVCVSVMRLMGRRGGAESLLLSLAGLACWINILSFLLAFRLTGPFIIMVAEMLMRDLLCFLSIYAVFSLGFTCAFTVLCGPTGLSHFIDRLEASILMIVGKYKGFGEGCGTGLNEMFAILLMVINAILVSVLLVNLLIAMMGATYERISQVADNKWLLEWARLMASLQHELTDSAHGKYWQDLDGGRFIQMIEQINPTHKQKTKRRKSLALGDSFANLINLDTVRRATSNQTTDESPAKKLTMSGVAEFRATFERSVSVSRVHQISSAYGLPLNTTSFLHPDLRVRGLFDSPPQMSREVSYATSATSNPSLPDSPSHYRYHNPGSPRRHASQPLRCLSPLRCKTVPYRPLPLSPQRVRKGQDSATHTPRAQETNITTDQANGPLLPNQFLSTSDQPDRVSSDIAYLYSTGDSDSASETAEGGQKRRNSDECSASPGNPPVAAESDHVVHDLVHMETPHDIAPSYPEPEVPTARSTGGDSNTGLTINVQSTDLERYVSDLVSPVSTTSIVDPNSITVQWSPDCLSNASSISLSSTASGCNTDTGLSAPCSTSLSRSSFCEFDDVQVLAIPTLRIPAPPERKPGTPLVTTVEQLSSREKHEATGTRTVCCPHCGIIFPMSLNAINIVPIEPRMATPRPAAPRKRGSPSTHAPSSRCSTPPAKASCNNSEPQHRTRAKLRKRPKSPMLSNNSGKLTARSTQSVPLQKAIDMVHTPTYAAERLSSHPRPFASSRGRVSPKSPDVLSPTARLRLQTPRGRATEPQSNGTRSADARTSSPQLSPTPMHGRIQRTHLSVPTTRANGSGDSRRSTIRGNCSF